MNQVKSYIWSEIEFIISRSASRQLVIKTAPEKLMFKNVEFHMARSHGVMVSTLDSESSDPSSNLGGTYESFAKFYYYFEGKNHTFNHRQITKNWKSFSYFSDDYKSDSFRKAWMKANMPEMLRFYFFLVKHVNFYF